jgi:hypothetical protein
VILPCSLNLDSFNTFVRREGSTDVRSARVVPVVVKAPYVRERSCLVRPRSRTERKGRRILSRGRDGAREGDGETVGLTCKEFMARGGGG